MKVSLASRRVKSRARTEPAISPSSATAASSALCTADLSDGGESKRGGLGVQIKTMSEEVANALGYDEPRGAVVEDVVNGSPAEDAGFENGDIILRVDGKDVEEMRDLPRLIAGLSPETELEIEVLRKGASQTISVTLGHRSADDA